MNYSKWDNLEVDDDPTKEGSGSAAHAAAGPECDDGNPVSGDQPSDFEHLAFVRGTHHGQGRGCGEPLPHPDGQARPEVAAVGQPLACPRAGRNGQHPIELGKQLSEIVWWGGVAAVEA